MVRLFEMVGLNPTMLERYPHEFSGGMRQRAVIAMALSCDPKLIIADEPTTALDVIVQDQILKELKKIQDQLGMSLIYISHDIAVIAEVTDTIGVMYAGKLVEYGSTLDVFQRPRHPYAYLLLSSTPSITGPRRKLAPLEGEPPNLLDPPTGCRFHPRCPFATEKCVVDEPPLEDIGGGHKVACWHWDRGPGDDRSQRHEPASSEGRQPQQALPGQPGAVSQTDRFRPCRRRDQLRDRAGRIAWAWWGSRVAASPPPGGC